MAGGSTPERPGIGDEPAPVAAGNHSRLNGLFCRPNPTALSILPLICRAHLFKSGSGRPCGRCPSAPLPPTRLWPILWVCPGAPGPWVAPWEPTRCRLLSPVTGWWPPMVLWAGTAPESNTKGCCSPMSRWRQEKAPYPCMGLLKIGKGDIEVAKRSSAHVDSKTTWAEVNR